MLRGNLRQNWELACDSGKDKKTPENLLRTARERAEELLKNPVEKHPYAVSKKNQPPPVTDQTVSEYFEGYFSFNVPPYQEWSNRCTHAAFYDFDIDEDGSEVIDGEFEEEIRHEQELSNNTAAWEMHRKVGIKELKFFVSVDLGSPDDALIKSFSLWLKAKRREAGIAPIRRAFTEADFIGWHDQRLLAYLDLTLWAETQSRKITQFRIAEALFPNNVSATDLQIRRTIRPNALEIASEEVIDALVFQLRTKLSASA